MHSNPTAVCLEPTHDLWFDAGMAAENFSRIQWLTIAELAEAWAPDLAPLPASAIKRELQFGLYKLEKLAARDMRTPLDKPPKVEDLPAEDTMISREFVERFCTESEEWQLPQFWFELKAEEPAQPSFPGRPSVMNAIVQELEAVAERDELADTLAEQARTLSAWAKEQFRGQQTPQPKATENGIRIAYNLLKRGPAPRP